MFKVKVIEKTKTHILCSVISFSENQIVYEIMSKNMMEPERTHTLWRLSMTYWISKQKTPALVRPHPPIHTHARTHTRARADGRTHANLQTPSPSLSHARTEICNTYCFLRQQWFRESFSVLRFTYIAVHVMPDDGPRGPKHVAE